MPSSFDIPFNPKRFGDAPRVQKQMPPWARAAQGFEFPRPVGSHPDKSNRHVRLPARVPAYANYVVEFENLEQERISRSKRRRLLIALATTLSATTCLLTYTLLKETGIAEDIMSLTSGSLNSGRADSSSHEAPPDTIETAEAPLQALAAPDPPPEHELQSTSGSEPAGPAVPNTERGGAESTGRTKNVGASSARRFIQPARRQPVRAAAAPSPAVPRPSAQRPTYGWMPTNVSDVPSKRDAPTKAGDIVRELPPEFRGAAPELPPEYRDEEPSQQQEVQKPPAGGQAESRGFVSVETSADRAREVGRIWSEKKRDPPQSK